MRPLRRWTSAAFATLLACAESGPPGPLHLVTSAAGPDTKLMLVAEAGLKLNARVAPALELAGGNVLRFGGARLTPDSAYFAEPPSAVLSGRHHQVHGILRASVCREDEQVCRSLEVRL
jgi:hypothetical protein